MTIKKGLAHAFKNPCPNCVAVFSDEESLKAHIKKCKSTAISDAVESIAEMVSATMTITLKEIIAGKHD